MKLIRLYIENFGGLHQYSLSFTQGLNTVLEPNGFGKTTLAEFIRAMFYGFPRAAKKLEKNPRKKYLPWQGGKYGGNLVFEHGGREYRIERTFGETPRTDSFLLTDAATHEKSPDFTENIGVELFGLDADSFERSTYLPQLRETGPLTTTGIQAKLGDLVADTNDINNYDKALEALKKKRSSYVPYKGTSGSVAEANQRISQLQLELDTLEAKRPELADTLAQLEQTRLSLGDTALRLEALGKETRLAAQYSAREALVKQQAALAQSLEDTRARSQALAGKYPQGLPTPSELERGEAAALNLSALEQQAGEAPEESQALLDALAPRFAQGLPTPEALAQGRERIRAYREAEAKEKNLIPGPGEAEQLEALEALFRPGVPEEGELARWDALARERDALEARRSAIAPDPGALEALEGFFGSGVPSEETLADCQQKLNRAQRLRQENVRISAQILPEPPAPEAQKNAAPLLALLGLLAILAGAVLLALQFPGAGAALLGVGVLLLALFFLIKQKRDRQELERKIQAARPSLSALQAQAMAENEQAAASDEQEVLAFTAAYPCTGGTLSEKLMALRSNRESLLALREKQAQAESLRKDREAVTQELQALLKPYFGEDPRFGENILTLRQHRTAYLRLLEARERRDRDSAALFEILRTLETPIRQLLEPYYGPLSADAFDATLNRLEREADAYTDARKRVEAYNRRRTAQEAEMAGCRAVLEALETKYALTGSLSHWSQVRQLREDAAGASRLAREAEAAREALEEFRREHSQLLALPQREDLRSLEDLQAEDARLSEALREGEALRASLEQKQRLLTEQLDRIGELEDELSRWKAQRAADLDRSRLLDETIRFLQDAKSALSHSYLGPIQRKFTEYMGLVTGESRETLFVSPELEISLERLGEARPLGCFSAGQTDSVLLCMRMALVDALFREAQPFVILDDPFVNLDETHLPQALSLLSQLSETRQILYLTCHSARTANG